MTCESGIFEMSCAYFDLPPSNIGITGRKDAGITLWINTFVHFVVLVQLKDVRVSYTILTTDPEGAILLQCEDDWDCHFCFCRFNDFFLKRPDEFHQHDLLRRWPSLVWFAVYWAYVFVSWFNLMLCGRNTINLYLLHVQECFWAFRWFQTMFAVSFLSILQRVSGCYRGIWQILEHSRVFSLLGDGQG